MYLKEESVELAIRLFDETELVLGKGEGVMRVKKRDWENELEGVGGRKEEAKTKSEGEKKKMARRAEKLLSSVSCFSYLFVTVN